VASFNVIMHSFVVGFGQFQQGFFDGGHHPQ